MREGLDADPATSVAAIGWRRWRVVLALAVTLITLGMADAVAREPLVTAMSFLDARHGALVVDECAAGERSCPQVMFTTDGGRTSRPGRVPGRGPVDLLGSAGDGWLAARGSTIYRAGSASARWEPVRFPGALQAWAARHTGAWAITRPCAESHRCAIRLWHSYDAGRSWWWSTAPRAARQLGPKDDYVIAFSNAADGAVAYRGPRDDYTLATTHDAGHSWNARGAPCGAAFSQYLRMDAAADGSIWIACGSSAATGNQGHQLFVSTDGARTFALRGEAAILKRDSVGRGLGSIGYLGQITPASARVAYLTLLRRGLLRTTDGGRTWRRIGRLDTGDDSGLAATAVLPGGRRVWQSLIGVGLWTSIDAGRRWVHLTPTRRVRRPANGAATTPVLRGTSGTQ